MKSREPSGVARVRQGVSISRKPFSDITRRIVVVALLRTRSVSCIDGRRRSMNRASRRRSSLVFS